MSAVTDCKLLELTSRLPQPIDYLFVSASYEERAYGVCEQLFQNVRADRFVCYNENHIIYLQESVERFKALVSDIKLVPLDSDRPLKTFNALRDAIASLKSRGPCHVGVDITCFTREATSIFIFLLKHELPKGSVVTAFYQKASSYGRSRRGGWLTEGVREVRTILGYSGSVSLSADTHLIIVPGFEYERAQEIVDAVQPARISLGHAIVEKGVALTFNLDHDNFLKRLEGLYLGLSLDRFDFSSVDPFKTRDNLLKVVQTSSKQNIVVACLNTKPATFGICLAALEQPSIQLVYAQPVCYNINEYSQPLGEVVFFTIPIS
jgi:hypothetical protein